MKIGIDIDDTICNTHAILIKYAQKYSKEVFKKDIVKYDSNNFMEVLGCNEEEMNKYFSTYYTEALKEVIPFYGVKEVLNKLRKMGHEIIFITVRNDEECKESAYNLTKKWLKKFKIPYDILAVGIKNKKTFCKENSIDIFIDDSITTCEKVADLGIKVFLANASFNVKYENSNITKVYDMFDFLNKIEQTNLTQK